MPEAEAQNTGEAVAQIRDLITGIPAEAGKDTGSGDTPSPAAESPESQTQEGEPAEAEELTPKHLAEKLGISADDLFKTFKIPMEQGEALTLEEYKAVGKDSRELKAAQDELAEGRVKFENDTMLQRQTLQAAIGKIPPGLLTEQMLEEVQSEHRAHVEAERTALHTVRPDLKDPAKWSATRQLLVDHLKPYGFMSIEVDSIIDHRLAKYVIDNAERAQRLAGIQEEVAKRKVSKPSPKPAAKPSKSRDKETVTRGKRAVSNRDKAAEVAKLLG